VGNPTTDDIGDDYNIGVPYMVGHYAVHADIILDKYLITF